MSMRHITKLIIRIPMNRANRKIKTKIGQEKCGLFKWTGIKHVIFTFGMMLERAIQMQKVVYLCFIEYATVFDRVRYKELLQP